MQLLRILSDNSLQGRTQAFILASPGHTLLNQLIQKRTLVCEHTRSMFIPWLQAHSQQHSNSQNSSSHTPIFSSPETHHSFVEATNTSRQLQTNLNGKMDEGKQTRVTNPSTRPRLRQSTGAEHQLARLLISTFTTAPRAAVTHTTTHRVQQLTFLSHPRFWPHSLRCSSCCCNPLSPLGGPNHRGVFPFHSIRPQVQDQGHLGDQGHPWSPRPLGHAS